MLVRNFLFHRVSTERDPLWDPIDPALFERALDAIVDRFRVVALEKWFLAPGHSEDETPLCTLGFDDGYKDNVVFAAPALKRRGLPASFYVVTDCIDLDRPTWTYELDSLLSGAGTALAEARAIKARLKELSHRERELALEEIRRRAGCPGPRKGMMMTWDDVRTLVREGFTVGSHSKTHGMLATMDDPAALREELAVSRDVIARETGAAPIAISYPVGSFDERVIAEAKACGYRLGLATGQKTYDSRTGGGLFRIPRVELYNESWLKTKLRIDGTIETVRAWLGR
jgi:peptidoglycan/xylan/chitin deacetylase (PgdA/CDA1 family)